MASSALVFVVFSAFPALASSCLASGICGMHGGCGGGYVPPPMPPVCNPGCGRGYACGSYGCYRVAARVHSSKTMAIPDQNDQISLSPDEKFSACCRDRHLPDSCMDKCSYGTYTKESLRAMYFKTDKCPSQAAADIHFCAAQGRDHSTCCRNNAVATTLAGEKCMAFCDQRPGKVTQLDVTYIACYHRFDQMKTCFLEDLTSGIGSRLPPVSVPVEESNDDFGQQVDGSNLAATTRKTSALAKTFKQH